MPEDSRDTDADIVREAYAEKVREAFKIFAENLGMGQNQKNSAERFLRALELTRKARDMALDVVNGVGLVEPTVAPAAKSTDPNKVSAADMAPVGDGLSAEDQKMIEQALAGTTGHKPLLRR